MNPKKLPSFLLIISFFFFAGAFSAKYISAQFNEPPEGPPQPQDKPAESAHVCAGGDCCADNPDCHTGGQGQSCPGCSTVYASPDGNIIYCVDNNQLCGPNQTCSNGTCINVPPPCSGCQVWNGTACVDNNAYCSGGLVCQNGTCVAPSPTPTPGNLACNATCTGSGQCNSSYCIGGICRNSACINDTDCVCATSTPSPTSNVASPTPVKIACNNSNITRGGCVTNTDCASGLSCISNVCQNAACPGDSDCVCGATSTPTNTLTPTLSPTGSATPTPTSDPSIFRATINPTSCTTVTLNWTDASPVVGTVTSYFPEFKLPASGTWTSVPGTYGNTARSASVTGLSGGTTYNFRVGAQRNPPPSYTNVISITMPACPPTATNSPTATFTPTATPIGSFACNGAGCTGSAQCVGMSNPSCVAGVCRNSACVSETDCVCGATNTPTPVPGGTCAVLLDANPATVSSGGSSTLIWSANSNTIAGTCVASGAWSGSKANSGSQSTGALTGPASYTITCQNSTGVTCSDTATVSVGATSTPTPSGLACNSVCTGGAQCGTGFCYLGACRQGACPTDTDCLCGGVATATLTPSPSPTGSVNQTVSGTVLFDTANNNCVSGTTGYGTAQLQVRNDTDSSLVGTQTSNSSGVYAPITSSTTPNAHILISNIGASNVVKGVRDTTFGAGFTISYTSGLGYGFDWAANPNKTIDFCVGNAVRLPWLQVVNGDFRSQLVDNPVPDTRVMSPANPSAPTLPPGNIFSSVGQTTIPTGKISSTNWQVNREYSEYNNSPAKSLGSTSYSFYQNQIQKAGVTPIDWLSNSLPNTLPMGTPPASMAETGVIYVYNGNLTINQPLAISANSKVIFLVNGTVTIQSPVTVPTTSLFILAAKGNITIQSNASLSDTTSEDQTTAALQGIYSSEGSIILTSTATCDATPDQRLNVWGSLIANSLRPFATSGSGQVVNQRTLCIENRNTSSLMVYHRPTFAMLLTEILKTKSRRWSE